MKQADFEQRHETSWRLFEEMLLPEQHHDADRARFPALYRQVCSDLALAKRRRYSPELISRLNDLATRGYFLLYGAGRHYNGLWMRFVVVDFPLAIYRNRLFVAASALFFLVPMIVMGLIGYGSDELIYGFFDAGELRSMESMYDPEGKYVGRARDSGDDWQMFAFYIMNNIGIAFQTFATGLLFCLGSLFFLVYNGMAIGGVAGHLTKVGYGVSFYPFVVGHSAFELCAIVLSGAAGLRIGTAVLTPGNYSRITALRLSAREAAVVVYGAAAMLVFAAALEAFWSSKSALPEPLKYAVGGSLWLLLLAYLGSGWRRHRP